MTPNEIASNCRSLKTECWAGCITLVTSHFAGPSSKRIIAAPLWWVFYHLTSETGCRREARVSWYSTSPVHCRFPR
jgi:hypothetical protein